MWFAVALSGEGEGERASSDLRDVQVHQNASIRSRIKVLHSGGDDGLVCLGGEGEQRWEGEEKGIKK